MKDLGFVFALTALGFLVTVAASAPSASIEGRVLGGWPPGPVPFANVLLFGSRRGTMTDSAGHFRLKDVPPGRQTLEIMAIPFKPWAETLWSCPDSVDG